MQKTMLTAENRKVKGQSRESMESGIGMWIVNKCFTSTTLVFHAPKSPVIKCVLDKYGDPVFIECIESDTTYDGAYCILNEFKTCFLENGVRNDLRIEKQSQPLLRLFNSSQNGGEHRVLSNGERPKKLRKKQKKVVTAFVHPEFIESFEGKHPCWKIRLLDVESIQTTELPLGDAELASSAMLSKDWFIAPYKRVVWLGSLGW